MREVEIHLHPKHLEILGDLLVLPEGGSSWLDLHIHIVLLYCFVLLEQCQVYRR